MPVLLGSRGLFVCLFVCSAGGIWSSGCTQGRDPGADAASVFINPHVSSVFKPRSEWTASSLTHTEGPHDKTASNLMITISCSPLVAPHSGCFVSNWSVPFAWLVWLPHFSLSPLWWLPWHYRCWVSLITALIGLEMFSCQFVLFWGGGVGLLKPRRVIRSYSKKINESHFVSRLWRKLQEAAKSEDNKLLGPLTWCPPRCPPRWFDVRSQS